MCIFFFFFRKLLNAIKKALVVFGRPGCKIEYLKFIRLFRFYSLKLKKRRKVLHSIPYLFLLSIYKRTFAKLIFFFYICNGLDFFFFLIFMKWKIDILFFFYLKLRKFEQSKMNNQSGVEKEYRTTWNVIIPVVVARKARKLSRELARIYTCIHRPANSYTYIYIKKEEIESPTNRSKVASTSTPRRLLRSKYIVQRRKRKRKRERKRNSVARPTSNQALLVIFTLYFVRVGASVLLSSV